MPIKKITTSAFEALQELNFSGNIRELRNIIERLVILSGQKITDEDVKAYVSNTQSNASPSMMFDQFEKFQEFKEHIEKLFIENKLKTYSWNVSKTAEALDIQRSHLYNKIEKYDLKRS
jgi:two-component system, NtrC family, nitrogen regulation response regulator NtrX